MDSSGDVEEGRRMVAGVQCGDDRGERLKFRRVGGSHGQDCVRVQSRSRHVQVVGITGTLMFASKQKSLSLASL